MPVVAAVGAAALVGGSIFQGQQQQRAQRRAERAQEHAQRLATSRAAAELRRQELDQRRLNRRKPNLSTILSGERQAENRGPGSTILTGAAGVGRERLTLGQSSFLGAP